MIRERYLLMNNLAHSQVYYTDIDEYSCNCIQDNIDNGNLPIGFVDCVDIKDIDYWDIKDYNQCHFFAGIGGWPLAFQMINIPIELNIWTGSCPCQPFSVSNQGKVKGINDERHLWPYWRNIIDKQCPAIIFGEQVTSPAGRQWLRIVYNELQAMGYAIISADICAAGLDYPHIRQRIYFSAIKFDQIKTTRIKRVFEYVDKEKRLSYSNGKSDADLQGQIQLSSSIITQNDNNKRWENENGLSKPIKLLHSNDNKKRANLPKESYNKVPNKEIHKLLIGTNKDPGLPWDFYKRMDGKYTPAPKAESKIPVMAYGLPYQIQNINLIGNSIVPELAAVFIFSCLESYRDILG